jgi:hypothetical protein
MYINVYATRREKSGQENQDRTGKKGQAERERQNRTGST